MPYYRCEDDGGGSEDSDSGADSGADDSGGDEGSSANDSDSGEDSSQGDGNSGDDYRSYLGLDDNGSDNPLGLSLGADKYIDQIGKMQDDVDRYSARDYADNYGDRVPYQKPLAMPSDNRGGGASAGPTAPQVPGQRPFEVPYTGAPDKPLVPIDPLGDLCRDIPLGPGKVTIKCTEKDYGFGYEVGVSPSKLADKGEGDQPKPWLEPSARAGVFVNLDNPEKSKVYEGIGMKSPVGGKDVLKGEYSLEDFKNDAEKVYNGALRAIGYPPSSPYANPW